MDSGIPATVQYLVIGLLLLSVVSAASATTELRFFRGDQETVNGKTYHAWNTTPTDQGTDALHRQTSSGLNATWGVRVWNRSSGAAHEITSGGLQAIVFRNDNTCGSGTVCSGPQLNTWTPPPTNLSAGDSLVLAFFTDLGGAVNNTVNFTSEEFEQPIRIRGVWNFTYVTHYFSQQSGPNKYTNATVRWGNATFNSTVRAFNYTRRGHVNASLANSSLHPADEFNLSLSRPSGVVEDWERLGTGTRFFESAVTNRVNRSLGIHGPVFGSFFDADIQQVNVTGAVDIRSQLVNNYTGSIPSSIGTVKTVYALNDTGLNYSQANVTFPTLGMEPNAILHCTDWNFSRGNCTAGAWQINDTAAYDVTENGTHLWFTTDTFDAVAPAEQAFLDVNLSDPPSPFSAEVNTTFLLNATVTCANGDCGRVNGTARYNDTGKAPDSQIPDFSGEPFHTDVKDSNVTCSSYLHQGESCNVTWDINATADVGSLWNVDVNFSTNTSVSSNDTDDAEVKVVAGVVDIRTRWADVSFGEVVVGNTHAAIGNTNRTYNVTVTEDSSTADLWLRGTNLNGTETIGVGNVTWNATENDNTQTQPLTDTFDIFKSGVQAGTNVTTYYWIDVPFVYAGSYNGTLEVKGNASS